MEPLLAAGLIGGAASLIGSGINAYGSYQDRKAARKAKEKANQQLTNWESEANRILEESARGGITLSDSQDLENYQKLRSGYDPSKYVYTDYQPFDKDSYHVEDYLNPAKDAILADVRKQILNTNIGQGLGHSFGAYEAIAQGVLDKDESLYDKAWDRLNTERNFDYGAYTDYINQKQKELDTLQQGTLNQMNFLRGDLLFDQQQRDALTANRLSLGNTMAQARASLV